MLNICTIILIIVCFTQKLHYNFIVYLSASQIFKAIVSMNTLTNK